MRDTPESLQFDSDDISARDPSTELIRDGSIQLAKNGLILTKRSPRRTA